MGNQLTAIAPSQVLPAEQYLNDIPHLEYIKNLGSTRFFKVVKAKTKEGLVVVKIFVLHDPTLQLKQYENQIEEINKKLECASNCKPFQYILKTDRAVMLCRQYIQYSLYDRISTRPFFTLIEKKWIAFLLLSAVKQCHTMNIHHGDIKSENVLISSWNWLILSDFATFKPVFLPHNNPADFSFYFDTSRRRTCYLAPERFIKGVYKLPDQPCSNTFDIATENVKKGELSKAMDVFSTGCVLIELFTEGMVPFDLSQLLAYISDEYTPDKIIKSIPDEGIRQLVSHMIQKNPNERDSIENYLRKHCGTTFPECFSTFLRPYCQKFSSAPLLHADVRIASICRDFDLMVKKTDSPGQKENFLILLPLVLSCVRKLKLCESKLVTLSLLKKCSCHVTSDIILDRLLPYVLYFINDDFSLVRCETIDCLLHCLKKVTFIPDSDVNIFTEYIFPLMNPLTSDKDLSVRIRFAKNIAQLAEESLRFLELSKQNDRLDEGGKWQNKAKNLEPHKDYTYTSSTSSYDDELSILHDFVQQKVVAILGDRSNAVKQAIMQDSITQLCKFFGRERANDVIFSHIITFLNDKQDWQLRAAFFQSVPGVVSYLGPQASSILSPLLQQGLSDRQEFVIQHTLECFSSLLKLGVIKKNIILEIVSEVIPMLIHPNQWIRSRAIGVVIQLAKRMDIVDFSCYILPVLQNYFVELPQDFTHEMLLLHLVKKPLPRQVYQQLITGKFNSDRFIDFLNKPKSLASKEENDPNVIFMRKLFSLGMTESDVENIKLMQRNILDHYRARNQKQASSDVFNGSINLAGIFDAESQIVRSIDFVYSVTSGLTGFSNRPLSKIKKSMNKTNSSEVLTMNDDWEQMFGSSNKQSSPAYFMQNATVNALTPDKLSKAESTSSLQLVLSTQGDKDSITYSSCSSKNESHKSLTAACKTALEELLGNIRTQQKEECKDALFTEERPVLNEWRPYGIMVAHLHEHRGAINRLRVSSDNRFFASCSNDGSVKVWDASGLDCLDGRNITNRSRFTYNKQAGQIKAFCFTDNSSMVVSASDTGSLHVLSTDCTHSKSEAILKREVDVSTHGLVVDINACDFESENVVSFVTVYGNIFGWDLRMPHKYAWQVDSDPKMGLITSFDIHRQCNWIITGSSNGHHTVWDMRFQLPINHFTHPQKSKVTRVSVDQFSQSRVVSSTQGNNEVTLWDVETTAKHKVLWGSPTPYLSNNAPTRHSVSNFYYNPNYCITAGTDMRLRFWDLSQASSSYIIVGSSMDSAEEIVSCISYQSKLIEATQVIHEHYKPLKRPSSSSSSSSSSPRTTPQELNQLNEDTAYSQEVPVGHRDIISDVAVCDHSQPFIITSSRDGVIKVWK